jgi:hypothetical protein
LFYGFVKKPLLSGCLLLASLSGAGAEQMRLVETAAEPLPDKVGEYRAEGRVETGKKELSQDPEVTSLVTRSYVSRNRKKFLVTAMTTLSDSVAYSRLSRARDDAKAAPASDFKTVDVGTAAFSYKWAEENHLVFFKGNTFVRVSGSGKSQDPNALKEFGRELAETVDRGEGDVPVLLKHLPGWPSIHEHTVYVRSKEQLQGRFQGQSILDSLNFAGGAEAVIGDYNGSKLVIVEFNTPQIASDNDARIKAKIEELKSQSQDAPSAYRRVGNYSVFVFNAPTEEAANQLIDQVKYEQLVQWLGRNPHLYDRATREFTQTTLGVFVAVVKASGLAIVGSLLVGGLVGAFLFSRRRKQRTAVEAYSDAGGMLRLNLDELTAQRDPGRLLGPGS